MLKTILKFFGLTTISAYDDLDDDYRRKLADEQKNYRQLSEKTVALQAALIDAEKHAESLKAEIAGLDEARRELQTALNTTEDLRVALEKANTALSGQLNAANDMLAALDPSRWPTIAATAVHAGGKTVFLNIVVSQGLENLQTTVRSLAYSKKNLAILQKVAVEFNLMIEEALLKFKATLPAK